MCYFDGQHAKRRVVSKRKPIRAWKLLYRRTRRGEYKSPVFRYEFRRGKWVRASAHGFYALKSRAQALKMRLGFLYKGSVVVRVALAGRVREYATGYRAQYMRIV
jgi:hypothetical protein